MEQITTNPSSLQPTLDPVSTIVQAALEGYKAKHPDADAQELGNFKATVEDMVQMKHLSKTGIREAKKHRRERSAACTQEMKNLGLEAGHIRMMAKLSLVNNDTGESKEVSAKLLPTGGMSVVYKVVGDTLVLAGALCSKSDNFDRLCGREIAVERFKEGVTVDLPVTTLEQVNPTMLKSYYAALLHTKKSKAS